MKNSETILWASAITLVLALILGYFAFHPIVKDEFGNYVQVCYQLTLGVPQPYHPVPCK